MEVNFLFWKISSQASMKKFLNFSFEKMDHVIYPPQVQLVGNCNPPTRKHILFLNKNISLIKEYYLNAWITKFQRKRCDGDIMVF